MSRTLAIGDIHGRFTALSALLNAVAPTPGDKIIFLGDYIDRGPDSDKVLDLLSSFSKSAIFLKGNHEVMTLQSRLNETQSYLWQSYGGFETLISYKAEYRDDWAKAIPRRHWKFLESTLPYYETETHIFVHAFLEPHLDLKDQSDEVLYWERFDRIKPHKSGKQIICGHTSHSAINNQGHAICIDTGAVCGGWLTCLDVNSGHFWQANERGEHREGMLEYC